MKGNARDILLLAAEDAFEFERWRDAGPLTVDIDAEASAAEIAEFEALGIPMPRELDSLKREMEHAPKVRDAIRNSALVLRRSGRASSSALVALAPTALVHPAMMDPRFGGPMGMDPRMMAAMDPRLARPPGFDPRMAAGPVEPVAEPVRARRVAVVADAGPVEAEVIDARPAQRSRRAPEVFDDGLEDGPDDIEGGFDDEDEDELERERRARERRRQKQRQAKARKARARQRDWEDDDFDDDDDSLVAVVPMRQPGADRNTMIVGGIALVAIVALLWVMFDKDKDDEEQVVADTAAQQAPPVQPTAPPPTPAPTPAIDPNTGLPYGQAPTPIADAGAMPSAAPSGRRGGGGGGGSRRPSGSGGGAPANAAPAAPGAAGALGGLSDLSGAPGSQPAPGAQPAPAQPGQAQPAQPGQTPPANGQPPATDPQAAPAENQPAPGGEAEPAPAEPKPEELAPVKQKMTGAQRQAIIQKSSQLHPCLEVAQVGKPDLGGTITFTITLDQDGVVQKVAVANDPVGYGVAKCAKKKIKSWTLPSGGIPMIFDVPLGFQ